MKKIVVIISIIIFIILMIGLFVKVQNKKVEININELGEKLINEDIYDDNLILIDKDVIIKKYNFNEESIKNLVSYLGTKATAEEILIIELTDKSYLNEINKQLEKYIEDQKINFQNYLPEEVYKIENCILKSEGNYIILCISNNPDKADKIINQFLKN